MAGNYPDAPSWRMAWDRDGTQFYFIDSGGQVRQYDHASALTANDESNSAIFEGGSNPYSGSYLWLFPELRDVDAMKFIIAASAYGMAGFSIFVSEDTTNGIDGTWVGVSGISTIQGNVSPAYRSNISSSTALAIRGLKASFSHGYNSVSYLAAAHFFGEPAPGENPKRLEIWHETEDHRVAPAFFDWGNVPRGSSADKKFRIKNMSPDKTARAIRVAMDVLSDANPSVPGQHVISQDGGDTFGAQQTIGDLAPGAISQPLILRRITPSNAVMGVWAFRLFSAPASWS